MPIRDTDKYESGYIPAYLERVRSPKRIMEIGVKNATAGQSFTWYGYEVLYRHRRVVRRGTGMVAS